MDSSTLRVLTVIRDYLDDVEARSTRPISDEALDALNGASKALGDRGFEEELSPGERQAMESSEALIQELKFSDVGGAELTPGQRAAQGE